MSDLKKKALYFLARRDYAYHELFEKLNSYTQEEDSIYTVLNELKAKGWLSEERFISSYINSKSKKYGLLKIKHLLYRKSGDIDLVDELLKSSDVDQLEVAYQLWIKKFGDSFEVLEQKTIARGVRFLQSRGFGFDIIKAVLDRLRVFDANLHYD
jgi:regulatory protein